MTGRRSMHSNGDALLDRDNFHSSLIFKSTPDLAPRKSHRIWWLRGLVLVYR